MPYEIAGVTADLALVEYPNRIKVRDSLRKVLGLEILPADLQEGLATVWEATRVENPYITGDPEGRIHGALTALRETLESAAEIPTALFMPEAQPEPVWL